MYRIPRLLPSLFIVLILTISISGCHKNDGQVLFKMEYDQLMNVPGGLNTVETYSFLIQNIPTNFNQLLSTFNVSAAAIMNIRPGSIRLNDDFNQFDFIKVEKISLLASKPNFINEVEIGYLEPVPLVSANSLQLFPTLVDGSDIFTGEKFNLKLKIKLRNFNPANTNLRLRVAMNAVNK